ncbi:hypothetical protein D6C97_10268 [Aureobasidium pullulans]|nr:hypothetical protein D6C97_10268 [Aureobasidium pullulans]
MNRYGRAGFVGGASSSNRASANTVCQKCLKKGHYSYDCKAQAQERPYISRPSRSQQLLNPKLKPKLANIAPTEENLSAIQKPSKEASARPRKRSLNDMDGQRSSRKRSRSRSRSVSSFSSDSVATISTRSPSPDRSRPNNRPVARQERDVSARGGAGDKRRRPSSSASSPDHMHESQNRNTRMRRSSRSPSERGRRRGRSANSERRMRSASVKDTRGLTPARRPDADGRPTVGQQHTDLERADHSRDQEMRDVPSGETRTRSLSPFSKRVALTQSMNR